MNYWLSDLFCFCPWLFLFWSSALRYAEHQARQLPGAMCQRLVTAVEYLRPAVKSQFSFGDRPLCECARMRASECVTVCEQVCACVCELLPACACVCAAGCAHACAHVCAHVCAAVCG